MKIPATILGVPPSCPILRPPHASRKVLPARLHCACRTPRVRLRPPFRGCFGSPVAAWLAAKPTSGAVSFPTSVDRPLPATCHTLDADDPVPPAEGRSPYPIAATEDYSKTLACLSIEIGAACYGCCCSPGTTSPIGARRSTARSSPPARRRYRREPLLRLGERERAEVRRAGGVIGQLPDCHRSVP